MRQLLPLALALLAACQSGPEADVTPAEKTPQAAPPLKGVDSAYEAAARLQLPETAPAEHPGLVNVYRLSDRIVSGSEPESEEGFAELQRMGIHTILSVDGKVPDRETAAKYGLRYVHVPIQYKGITPDEMLRIAKTFRELEGPVYVHCFHGKHRGPAAAAVGRLACDGVSRERALAEMRQWCGTSASYEGLYLAIATQEVPDTAATRAYAWDFPPAEEAGDVRGSMVAVSRHWDVLEALSKRGWTNDPHHPDLNPEQEAVQLEEAFGQALALESDLLRRDDFHDWMQASREQSAALRAALEAGEQARADKAIRVLKQTCGSCHTVYRNR